MPWLFLPARVWWCCYRMRELQLRDLDGAADRAVADRNVTQGISDFLVEHRLVGWGEGLGSVGDVEKLAFGK
jgi:hypothetical protein